MVHYKYKNERPKKEVIKTTSTTMLMYGVEIRVFDNNYIGLLFLQDHHDKKNPASPSRQKNMNYKDTLTTLGTEAFSVFLNNEKMMNQSKGRFNLTCILIYSKLTVNIFCGCMILTNIIRYLPCMYIY